VSKILDLFGIDTGVAVVRDWTVVVKKQQCPFLGKRCYKSRKSQPEISIGTCTVAYGGEPIIICPNRLLERKQVFTDCLHLLTGHQPGNELHILSEVTVPGGSIDFVLVSALERKIKDFVGIELQTLDTTGTVWPERQRFLHSKGLPVPVADIESTKSYGMNWKMTAKTILVQLHHKIQTFEHINKHLVLVTQDRLLGYMRKEFSFGHLAQQARVADPMHFHAYSLANSNKGHQIKLTERVSTDTAGIARCLGLHTESNVELEMIVAALEAKLSERTVFSL
jgi:Restriction endonuclease NotI